MPIGKIFIQFISFLFKVYNKFPKPSIMIPEPLLNAIQTKRCLLFLGAGFSKNADLPDGSSMPSWKELAVTLSEEIRDKSDDPLKVASNYARQFGKNQLIRRLSELLYVDRAKPGKVHEKLTTIIEFDTIVTTNFEFLIEKAYSNKPIQTIVGDEHIGKYSPSTHTNIIKIHGDFTHHGDIVVTQEDYDEFLEKHHVLASTLESWFSTKTPLFIGYSLSDSHFQQLRKILKKQLGDLMNKGYMVLFDADNKTIKEHEDDDLFVINLKTNGNSKEDILLEFLSEIQDYISVKNAEYSSLISDETLDEKIPSTPAKTHKNKILLKHFSEFETTLKKILKNYGVKDESKQPFSYFVKMAAQYGILLPNEMEEIFQIRDICNEIRHSAYDITKNEMAYVTNKIKDIQDHILHIKYSTIPTTLQLSTDKTTYTEGMPIIISGKVDPIIANAPVSIRILDPKNHLIAIMQIIVDELGKFSTEFQAGGVLWDGSGTYSIYALYGNTSPQQKVDIEFLKDPFPSLTLSHSIQMKGKNYVIPYQINGAVFQDAFLDFDLNFLIVKLMSYSEGKITIAIPRELLDAKINHKDDQYLVLIDGDEGIFDERRLDDKRILSIQFPKNAEEIEIIGTRIGGQATPTSNIIEILPGSDSPNDDEKYLEPQTMVIKKGQTVTWNNTDSESHTITSGTPESGPDRNFDSGLFPSKNEFSHKFEETGTYRYFCAVHPWKEGKIIVTD